MSPLEAPDEVLQKEQAQQLTEVERLLQSSFWALGWTSLRDGSSARTIQQHVSRSCWQDGLPQLFWKAEEQASARVYGRYASEKSSRILAQTQRVAFRRVNESKKNGLGNPAEVLRNLSLAVNSLLTVLSQSVFLEAEDTPLSKAFGLTEIPFPFHLTNSLQNQIQEEKDSLARGCLFVQIKA